MKRVTIIGGGPAALMLAAHLDPEQYIVTVYEKKKRVGRKFLVAGEGGLNLTYNASLASLTSCYEPSDFMAPALSTFDNQEVMQWLATIGVPTFTGSSHRVFPTPDLKPIEVLNKIIAHCTSRGVHFKCNTEWLGWKDDGAIYFDNPHEVGGDIVIFSLGGASWKVTGSDGSWRALFQEKGIKVLPFRAANCAFEVMWPQEFIAAYEGKPLKNIALNYKHHTVKGELMITHYGLEGNAIYALSHLLHQALLREKQITFYIDLKPMLTAEQVAIKYKDSRQSNVTNILKKDIRLDRTALALLQQFTNRKTYTTPTLLFKNIKALPITITGAGPLDEAISTLGGIALEEVDAHFQLKKIPQSYAIGEMLDWYAPTGGYLLQACFSMGFALAAHLNKEQEAKKTIIGD